MNKVAAVPLASLAVSWRPKGLSENRVTLKPTWHGKKTCSDTAIEIMELHSVKQTCQSIDIHIERRP